MTIKLNETKLKEIKLKNTNPQVITIIYIRKRQIRDLG